MEAYETADPQPEPQGKSWLLPAAMVGDAVIFVLFAAIGRASHGEAVGNAVLRTLGTALPFLAGWLVGALTWKAYAAEALRDYRTGLWRVVLAWVTGAILALAIRSVLEHRIVPASFAAIAFGFNMILLLLWRTALVTAARNR